MEITQKKTDGNQPETPEKNTRIIAVSYDKGGCTKTTTAVHLAHGLALEGKTVLLIDSDPQSADGNMAMHLGITEEMLPSTLLEFIDKGDMSAVYEARENLYIIRGGFKLNALRSIIVQYGLGNQYIFRDAVDKIKHLFDFIIFDTPPSFDELNYNSLFYADEIIIPLNLEGLTVNALSNYLDKNINRVQSLRQVPLEWGYCLPTKHDRRTSDTTELLAEIGEFFNSSLMTNQNFRQNYENTAICEPIRTNISISRAARFGKTVFEYAPYSSGANDYRRFARIVMGAAKPKVKAKGE